MKIEDFARIANLKDSLEIEKVAKLAYYFSENKDQSEFDINEICNIIFALGFAKPNISRLKRKIKKSKDFVKGHNKDTFRLSIKANGSIKKILPDISESEDISSDDTLLPEILFEETRRFYLLRVVQQINASYENNLFDACALMMRRLLEILIIHIFQHKGLETEIQSDEGDFNNLKTLINKAKSMSEINLSPSVKKSIDDFRELGNLSAHRITYSCRRDDIRPLRMEYRAVVEELLYKTGFKE